MRKVISEYIILRNRSLEACRLWGNVMVFHDKLFEAVPRSNEELSCLERAADELRAFQKMIDVRLDRVQKDLSKMCAKEKP